MAESRAPLDLGRLTKMAEDLAEELNVAAVRSTDAETKLRAGRAEIFSRVLILTLQKDEREAAKYAVGFVGDTLNNVLGALGFEIRRKDK